MDAVIELFGRYMAKFDLAPQFSRDEMFHWFLPKRESDADQVIWTYVVEVSLFLII